MRKTLLVAAMGLVPHVAAAQYVSGLAVGIPSAFLFSTGDPGKSVAAPELSRPIEVRPLVVKSVCSSALPPASGKRNGCTAKQKTLKKK